MRYVADRHILHIYLVGLILTGLSTASGCVPKANMSWKSLGSDYHLAFLNYTTPTVALMSSEGGSNLSNVQIAVRNSSSQTMTNGGPYLVSLGIYSDSNCLVPALLSGATNNAVGTPATTSRGIASVSLDGGNEGEPLIGTPYYLKASSPGITSACSNTLTFRNAPANLVIPIEMLDLPASATAAVTQAFTRSQTSLDTDAYDGSVSYFFEIVSEVGSGTGTGTVILENNASLTFASISVPISTTPTRYRTSFTPTAGVSNYRVKIIAPTTGTLKVHAARMIVQQTGATKTKIYIPLLNGANDSPYQNVDTVTSAVLNGSNSSYALNQSPNTQTYWTKSSNAYQTLSSTNPWSLEVVWSNTSGTTYAGLYDIDTASIVPASEMSTSDTTGYNLLQSNAFADAALTAGHRFQIATRSSTSSSHQVYRAGLWVTVASLSEAEIYNRIFINSNGVLNGAGQAQQHRILLDSSLYSSPRFYVETTANAAAPTAAIDVADCGVNDTGLGCISVGGSVTYLATNRYRGSQFYITNGNRYIFYWNSSGVSPSETATFVVIGIRR